MRLFLDTNIVVEYLEHRRYFHEVRLILETIRDGQNEGFVSQGCIYTLVYLLERVLKTRNIHRPEQTMILRRMMSSIIRLFTPIGIGRREMLDAMTNLQFDDLEDSLQHQCAIESQCGFLLTINVDDYKNVDQTQIVVLSPSAFVEQYLRKE